MSDMPSDSLKRLRDLRRTVRQLHSTMIADMKPFFHKKNDVTFRRLPYSDFDSDDIGVTVTCTALMSLATAGRLDLYDKPTKTWEMAFDALMSAPWTSSKLPECNNFTTILVLRTAGILKKAMPTVDIAKKTRDVTTALSNPKNPNQTPEEVALLQASSGKSPLDLVDEILARAKASETIKVGKYLPTSTLIYWFIDASDLLKRPLSPEQWSDFARWTSREFSRQVSLVTSSHDAMMDPVAMAMAACLAARLRRIAPSVVKPEDLLEQSELLPSKIELLNALRLLFQKQELSGIWPKYFPLFHYPDAGANYCFSFEMLEAVLNEFQLRDDKDHDIFSDDKMFVGVERAVGWIESNRVAYEYRGDSYCGWNSGGQLDTLRAGMPESWATGLVHMFLFRLEQALSLAIKRRLFVKYEADTLKVKKSGDPDWDSVIDIGVNFPKEESTSIKKVLDEEIIKRIKAAKVADAEIPIDHRLSALLFGPPGTSKTTLVRELARKIEWPYVEITPSHFLSQGLEQIYVRANEIFDDLMDLSGVVILFDEMDALVQRRDRQAAQKENAGVAVVEQPLDVTRQFLTTSMLPKLTKLHDQKRVLFFMATNHQSQFDSAIKRPGRFDLLLCMGPPTWAAKLEGMRALVPREVRDLSKKSGVDLSKEISTLLGARTKRKDVIDKLDLFSFGDTKSFLEHLCRRAKQDSGKLKDVVSDLNEEDFENIVKDWAKSLITLWENSEVGENPVLTEYRKDKDSSRRQ